jgi:hypothetical protein
MRTTATGQEPTVACPKCGTRIEITKVLSEQAQEQVRQQLQDQWNQEQGKQEEAFKVRLRQAAEKAAADAREAAVIEVADLKTALVTREKQVTDLRKTELQLRERARELDDQKQEQELEVARRLDEGRAEVESVVTRRLTEEHRLGDLAKDKQLADMRRELEDASRRAQQGSQQIQGEALELDLEETLRREFPEDDIQPVQVGQRGADVLHVVRGHRGGAGCILWESKNTKAFSDRWLPKLREDQRQAGAAIAVLVTKTMPEEGMQFGQRDGVWITTPAAALPLAVVLRYALLEVGRARVASQNQNEKHAALYTYLSGTEFKQRIEGILEPLLNLLTDHEREERARQAAGARREKAIKQAITGLAVLYGDVSGVVGGVLPRIERLELPPPQAA